ncbi:MAG: HAMP domain-containing histidine kinase [Clostridiales bacterium]|nr:HAMP domain-containing histidine kinase [Clostridiales bacterium]
MKSLFYKMIVLWLMVLLITFSVLTIGLNKGLERYFINQKSESLMTHCKSIQESFLSGNFFNLYNTGEMINEIRNLERYFDTQIFVVNTSGYVFVTGDASDLDSIRSELSLEDVESIFKDNIIVREGLNSALSDEHVITVGYPIKDAEGNVILALFIHASVPEVLEANKGVYVIIVSVLIMGIGLAASIIFIFSRSIIKVIKGLNDGVKSIAKGNYEQQFLVNRRDEIGELTASINIMTQSLKKSEVMRRDFISEISHDFRSPLTNIIGYSQGILDGTISEDDYLKYIEIIRSESERLKGLSDDILTLAEIQTMTMTESLEQLNLNGLILNTLDQFELVFKQKSLNVSIDLTEKDIIFWGNKSSIIRLLTNLMDNQVKFTPTGGEIHITTKVNEKIELYIKNSGPWIPDDIISDIWIHFKKGDESRNENKTSFGLGLAIVKEIISLHQGSITVENCIPYGVEFKIELPKQQKT